MTKSKKKAKKVSKVELPEPTPINPHLGLVSTKAVTPEEAMAHIGRGWILLQCDDDKTVVGCDQETYDNEAD